MRCECPGSRPLAHGPPATMDAVPASRNSSTNGPDAGPRNGLKQARARRKTARRGHHTHQGTPIEGASRSPSVMKLR